MSRQKVRWLPTPLILDIEYMDENKHFLRCTPCLKNAEFLSYRVV